MSFIASLIKNKKNDIIYMGFNKFFIAFARFFIILASAFLFYKS